MLSGVCSGSNHTHQIQFITNIEDHNKTLHKYCEMVKNNHEHSESTSKFISHDCFQLYCWPPQNRAQPVFSFSWRISAITRKPFSDQVIELKILTYFGCWCLWFTNNIHILHPRTTLSSDGSDGWCWEDIVGISRCMGTGTMMQFSTIDVMIHWVKRTIRNEILLSKMVYIHYTVREYWLTGCIFPSWIFLFTTLHSMYGWNICHHQ